MYKVSWFWELLPWEKILEDKILKTIESSYKQFWYTSIETPSVEKNEVLLAKWGEESKKQIFWLYWLAQWKEDLKNYSLHFDLTVPFARYVLDHQAKLTFPFKRNQIQKVWRWERAQRWRFREFYQADVDVIWDDRNSKKSQNLFYDAEIIFVMIKTISRILDSLDIDESAVVHISNKKIILWFLSAIGLEKISKQISSIIDKRDKISEEEFILELKKLNIDENKISKIIELIDIKQEDIATIWEKFDIKNQDLDEWIKEIQEVVNALNELGADWKFKIDLSIMRWLDYYTGTVFETFLKKDKGIGSIASGWRYEKLTSFINEKTEFSWVWWSIWVSRLESYIFEKVKNNKESSSEFLLILFEKNKSEILKLYTSLIDQGKNIELYPQDEKISKQFKYADKKWIPFCIMLGEDESKEWIYKIKDMKTWKIQEVKLK